jgi:multiple sugar transport system substrate-binding protein
VKIRRFKAILFLLLAMSLIAAACGGDDDADATTAAPSDDGGTATTAAPSDDGGAATTAAPSGEAVEIRWFIGMGAGTDAPVIPLQQAIVDEFNATKPLGDNISLKMEVVDADQAPTILQTQIAGGNPPDIVGPMGVRSAATFFGGWLDVAPYIESNNYDLSDFDPAFVDFWNIGGEQIGLPFGAFPQMLWYNSDHFDEAGLPYPPQEFGAPYVDADGTEKPWNVDTLREIAIVLSVDENGLTPADDGFDPNAQVQWGYCGTVQNEFRGLATMFGAGNFVAEDGKTFTFPEHWQDFAQWYHDLMWKDYVVPNPDFRESDLLANPSPLGSGNCSMMATHTWFQGWGTGELSFDSFDTAAIPAGPDGTITAKLHADTFAIPKSSTHPNEAFQVIGWMLGPEMAPQLAQVYGALPARISAQDAFVNDPANDAGFTWKVATDALAYPDIPSHEAWWPAYIESVDGLDSWWDPIVRNPNADIAAEIPKLEGILQPIFDRAEG